MTKRLPNKLSRHLVLDDRILVAVAAGNKTELIIADASSVNKIEALTIKQAVAAREA